MLGRPNDFLVSSTTNNRPTRNYSFGYLEEEEDEDEYYNYDKFDDKKNDKLKCHYEDVELEENIVLPSDRDDEEINTWQPNIKSKVYLVNIDNKKITNLIIISH